MDEDIGQKKCYHCGEPLRDRDKVCPRCGAAVDEDRTPRTIYELRAWCARHNVPLEKIRFFLGEDCQEARAFGIYQDDDGDFVVYKNKADGVRAVRYKGPDEAHAVNEIYQKLLSEIAIRRRKKDVQRSAAPRPSGNRNARRSAASAVLGITIVIVIAVIIAALILAYKFSTRGPQRGYYYYNDDYYYSQNDVWYWYDEDESDWQPYYPDEGLEENAEAYYIGRSYDEGYGIEDFSDSWYADTWDDDDDYDYDYDDYDDWDDDDWDDWDDDDWDDWDDWDTDWDSDW